MTKFNTQLATYLGLPHYHIAQELSVGRLLYSLKSSELRTFVEYPGGWEQTPYDVLWHDWDSSCAKMTRSADRVYAANPSIAADIQRIIGVSVSPLWCPGTIRGNPDRGRIRVLAFGMANRRQPDHLVKIARLLGDLDCTLELSCGIHEGTPWDTGWSEAVAAYRQVFGNRLRVLGFLADDGLAVVMRLADVVILPYEPAARANNTTLWAALEAGCTVITTLDEDSPPELAHGRNIYDLNRLTAWPFIPLRHEAKRAAEGRSWDRLLQKINTCAN